MPKWVYNKHAMLSLMGKRLRGTHSQLHHLGGLGGTQTGRLWGAFKPRQYWPCLLHCTGHFWKSLPLSPGAWGGSGSVKHTLWAEQLPGRWAGNWGTTQRLAEKVNRPQSQISFHSSSLWHGGRATSSMLTAGIVASPKMHENKQMGKA